MKSLKNIIGEISSTKEEKLERARKIVSEMEEIALKEFGIPISTPEEKIIQRKKLYEEIMNSQKNKSPIDSGELLNEVKFIRNMLDTDII